MRKRELLLRQLDQQLQEWQSLKQYAKPVRGWVMTIRKALGMTAAQLAHRMGVKRTRVVQLEKAEINDAVTLRALKVASEAMECELLYAIVPKTSLKNILKSRATKIATKQVERVAHSMVLESQAVGSEKLQEQVEELTNTLLAGSSKKLWQDSENK